MTKRVTAPMTRCRPGVDLASASVMSVVRSGGGTAQPGALEQEEERVDLGDEVGRRLQDAPAAAQDPVEAPVLAPRRVRRRQLRRAVAIAVELVPGVGHAREAEQARVERLLEPALHLRAARPPSGARSASTARPRPSTRARRSEWPRNAVTLAPSGWRVEEVDVLARRRPRLARRAGAAAPARAAPTRRG